VAPSLEQRAELRRRPGTVEVELRTQAVDRDDDDVARASGPLRVDRAADQCAQQGHGGEQAPARHVTTRKLSRPDDDEIDRARAAT
jgi:hypothetical protein